MAFLPPTSLFIATLLAVRGIGVVKSILAGGRPVPVAPPPIQPPAEAVSTYGILMSVFASGCKATTGVELVGTVWSHYPLHNRTSAFTKVDLHPSGYRRVVVINVP